MASAALPSAARAGSQRSAAARSDRRVVLWVAGAMLLLIVLFCLLGPTPATNDNRPTSYNTETPGIKASYLLLQELGYDARRSNKPPMELKTADPARTTLLLVEPTLPLKDRDVLERAIADFLSRGGRVVATGASGATLLPGGETAEPLRELDAPSQRGPSAGVGAAIESALEFCRTEPEGAGALARAGSATIEDAVRWTAAGPQFHVAQRCGPDAVAVSFHYGKGEAVWWASPLPMTNGGLAGAAEAKGNPEQEANVALLLASVGAPGRMVLFDEFLHEWHEGVVDDQKPLPWKAILWQLVAVAALLVLSLGRRSGPVVMPVSLPRSSPVEFALSMGRLYQKAGAASAAIDAAQERLLRFLEEQCGLTADVLRAGPEAVGAALAGRFGGEHGLLEAHLRQVEAQRGEAMTGKAALTLVHALEADEQALREQMALRPRMAHAGDEP